MSNAALKSKNQLLVELFNARCHANEKGREMRPLPVVPTPPSFGVAKLCARLILEEALEVAEAMGVAVRTIGNVYSRQVLIQDVEFVPAAKYGVSLVEAADGFADLEVVLLAAASTCGIAHQPIFDIVANNNLQKFAPGHTFDEGGKLIKPPDFIGPTMRIRNELLQQGWDGR